MSDSRPSLPRPARVVIRLGFRHKAARDHLGGILRFAATHPNLFETYIPDGHQSNDSLTATDDWAPDGVIADNALHLEGVRAAVFVNGGTDGPIPEGLPHGVVLCDDAEVGRTAARLLLGKGLRSFGFVGSKRAPQWSVDRGAAFCAAVEAAGSAVSSFVPGPESDREWAREERALSAWLAGLPKPVGVFAAFDQRAKHVLDACRAAGIPVPEQVQVVGVDNEEYICEQTSPSLSSVLPDFERGGYMAAETLAGLLAGEEPPAAPLRYGVKGVVERLSTQDARGAGRAVARALDFIRLHATSGISVLDVVRAVGGSQCLLERKFREVRGHTIVQEIQNGRLEKACDLLRRTTTPIPQIGALCGFESGAYLETLFKKRYGCTMRQWRKR